MDKNNNEIDVE